ALWCAVLDRNLHVIEAGIGELVQRIRGNADRRGDQIGVKAGVMGRSRDLDQIAARARLATGEMHLQHAERRGFGEHAGPGRGIELVVARIEYERVGAIGAAERTAVRQLGKQTERGMQTHGPIRRHHSSKSFLSASPRNMAVTSARMRSRGALKVLARSSTIASSVASPVQRLTISTAMVSALNTRSGANSTQPPCASLCTSRTPRGSRGRASAGIAGGVSLTGFPFS